jgi:hypothetical protein
MITSGQITKEQWPVNAVMTPSSPAEAVLGNQSAVEGIGNQKSMSSTKCHSNVLAV